MAKVYFTRCPLQSEQEKHHDCSCDLLCYILSVDYSNTVLAAYSKHAARTREGLVMNTSSKSKLHSTKHFLSRCLGKALKYRQWVLLPLLILFCWTRIDGLDKPVWQDEVENYFSARQHVNSPVLWISPVNLLNTISDKFFMPIGSLSLLRSPYLLVAALSIVFSIWLGRIWRNWFFGILLALALCLWPFKAYWDTMMRDYTLVMSTGIISITLWEFYRVRKTWKAFLIALPITIWSSRSHELSLLLLAAPFFYVTWNALCAFKPCAANLLKKHFAWRAFLKILLNFSAQLILCTLAFSMCLTLLLGQERASKLLSDTPVVKHFVVSPKAHQSSEPAIAKKKPPKTQPSSSPKNNAPKAAQLKTPKLKETLAFFKAKSNYFTHTPPQLSALLFLDDPRMLNQLVWGPKQYGQGVHPVSVKMEQWLAVIFLVGLLYLLFKSPPLFLTALCIVLGTSTIIHMNQHARVPMPRYFSLPAILALFCIICALNLCLSIIRWPLKRWKPTLHACAQLALAVSLIAIAFFKPSIPTINAAKFYHENWEQFFNFNRRINPTGFLMFGFGSKNIAFQNELATNAFKAAGNSDYLTSPARSEIREVDFNKPLLLDDISIFDLINRFDGFASFRPNYYATSYWPIKQYKNLFQIKKYKDQTLQGQYTFLEDMAFITKGHLAQPLKARFLKDQSTTEYHIQAHFEVPGIYDFNVYTDPNDQLVGIKVDGESKIAWVENNSELSSPTTKAQLVEDQLGPQWLSDDIEQMPFALEHQTKYCVKFPTNTIPMQGIPFELTFAHSPSPDRLPIIEWRCSKQEWLPVTQLYDLGKPGISQDAEGFTFNFPLRLKADVKQHYAPRFYLVDADDHDKTVLFLDSVIVLARQLKKGDIISSGEIRISNTDARKHLGHKMVLTLLPLKEDYRDKNEPKRISLKRDAIINKNRVYPPLVHFLIGYLRFVEKDGQLQIQCAQMP